MKQAIFKAKAMHGSITPVNQLGQNSIDSFEGEDIEVTIKKWSDKRTASQNRFLHSVVIPTAFKAYKDAGVDVLDEVETKYWLMMRVFYREILANGKVYRVPKSTSGLDKKPFSDLIMRIEVYLAECYQTVLPYRWDDQGFN